MLETSPLLSNRYKRITSLSGRPTPSSSSTNDCSNRRRKSSITFLLALTAISAIVTYYYDTNLAPYAATDSPHGFSVNEDFLTSVKQGSTVDATYGYMISDEQRSLARQMNIEKRVSFTCNVVELLLYVVVCRLTICSYHVLHILLTPLLSPQK